MLFLNLNGFHLLLFYAMMKLVNGDVLDSTGIGRAQVASGRLRLP